VVARSTTVGYLNNNLIRLTSKENLNKTGISHLGPQCAYPYFPEDTTYAVLFTELVSMNRRNLFKVVIAGFGKMLIFFLVKAKTELSLCSTY
jgi:hypothetical protein